MQTRAEGLVLAEFAGGIKPIGVFRKSRVTVGRRQNASDLLALFDFKSETIDVLIGMSGKNMQRWIIAQDFFNQSWCYITKGQWQKSFERVAKGVDGGLMPGIEQQDAS